ncbi:MAG: carboxypeptidase regulatory-like domain-containing protein [Candidatus Kryptoniota bacterium]
MTFLKSFLVLAIIAFSLDRCAPDAPHENSLDPLSPNYSGTGVLSGRVLTLTAPYAGISNVLVTIPGNQSAVFTSSDGSFLIRNVPAGQVTVVFTKSGYLTDTLQIQIGIGKTQSIEVHLDALPVISAEQVVTHKIDQWWPGAVYNATVSAAVIDADGSTDIDSVYVVVDTINFSMAYSFNSKDFEVTIYSDSLPQHDIQWLVGRSFVVQARDHEGAVSRSNPFYVTRIIESEAAPFYPVGLDTAKASPTFEWNPPQITFNYSYTIQVVRMDAGNQTVVWTQPGINSSLVSYSFPGILSSGTYFWTIAVVDNYGNSSRSKEAAFSVK